MSCKAIRGGELNKGKGENNRRQNELKYLRRLHSKISWKSRGRESKFFGLSGVSTLKERKQQVQKPKCGSMSSHVLGIARKSM